MKLVRDYIDVSVLVNAANNKFKKEENEMRLSKTCNKM